MPNDISYSFIYLSEIAWSSSAGLWTAQTSQAERVAISRHHGQTSNSPSILRRTVRAATLSISGWSVYQSAMSLR